MSTRVPRQPAANLPSASSADLDRVGVAAAHAADAMVLIGLDEDATVRLLDANAAFAALVRPGASPLAVLEGGTALAERVHHALSTGRSIRFDVEDKRADGVPFSAEALMTPLAPQGGRQRALIVVRDVTRRRRTERRLLHLAYHDSLTGLPNRELFMDRLAHGMQVARRDSSEPRRLKDALAVLFLDLDGFKRINDSLGHAAGDRLLTAVAKRLSGCVRSADTVARLGGDEFTLLLPGVSGEEDTRVVATKILEAVSSTFRIEGQDVFVTPSMGIALYPRDGTDPHTLLRRADIAMYAAKTRGKGRFCFYETDLERLGDEAARVAARLELALAEGALEARYQPLVSNRTDRVIGGQLQIHWEDAELGLVSPARFLPLVESTPLEGAVLDWMIDAACEHAVRWTQHSAREVRVAVSPPHAAVRTGAIVDAVRRALEAHELGPRALQIDVSEHTMLGQIEEGSPLHQLRELGVRVALQDFDSAHLALSQLRWCPVDVLKLDAPALRGGTNPTLVRGLVALGHSLGLEVMGTGVESASVRRELLDDGCDLVQGFFFGKARPAASLDQLIASGGPAPTHR